MATNPSPKSRAKSNGGTATRGASSTDSTDSERPVSSTHRASFSAPGLSSEVGAQVADRLQERLVALIDLSLTLKHIHWNVVGPSFIGVHQMLDPQYTGVAEMVDEVAERIATLGGVPSGLPGKLLATRTCDEYELGRSYTQAHLGALDLVYSGVISDHRKAIDEVDELDPVSGDLLITQTGELEEYHWFVRSHLEDYAGGLSTAGTSTELSAATAAVRRERSAASKPAARKRRAG